MTILRNDYKFPDEFMTVMDNDIVKTASVAPKFRLGIAKELTDYGKDVIRYRTLTGVSVPHLYPIGSMAVDFDDVKIGESYAKLWQMRFGFDVTKHDMDKGTAYNDYYKEIVDSMVLQMSKLEDKVIGDGFSYTPSGGSSTYVISGMYPSATETINTTTSWATGNPFNHLNEAVSKFDQYGYPVGSNAHIFLEYVNRGELRQVNTMGDSYEGFVNSILKIPSENIHVTDVYAHSTGMMSLTDPKYGKLVVASEFQPLEPYWRTALEARVEILHAFAVYIKDGRGYEKLTGQ